MTPVDASNSPDIVKYYVKSTKSRPKLKVGDYVRIADKRNILFSLKDALLTGIENCLKLMKF